MGGPETKLVGRNYALGIEYWDESFNKDFLKIVEKRGRKLIGLYDEGSVRGLSGLGISFIRENFHKRRK
jgi:hypothetical protein